MRYLAKLTLDKTHFLAVLQEAIVIVTLNDKGQQIRWSIFNKGNKADEIEIKNLLAEYNIKMEEIR